MVRATRAQARQLILAGIAADEPGMDMDAQHIAAAQADELIAEFEARDKEPKPRSATDFPTALEAAACAATATAVVALAWLSVANHALVPFLWGVDLGVHEFGHLVTFWAPWRVTAAAGSFFQVTAPFALGCYFLFARRQPLSAALCLAWAGTSARNVAVYIADAPYQRLSLWGGEGVLHDWAQQLAGPAMQYAGAFAGAVEASAWLLFAAAFVLAVAPVAVGVRGALAARASQAALAARRATLPVREPHRPTG